MNRTLLGAVILGIVAGGAALYSNLDLTGLTRAIDRKDPVALSIYYGGEKSALLKNPDVRDIIENRYKITLNATKAGSIEMVTSLPPPVAIASGPQMQSPSNWRATTGGRFWPMRQFSILRLFFMLGPRSPTRSSAKALSRNATTTF